MREIKENGIVIARHIQSDDIKPGLSFFSEDDEAIQIGVWEYNCGQNLLPHIHNVVERRFNRTCEALIVIRGKLEAIIYSINTENEIERIVLEEGDIMVLLGCGHGYRILEDGTKVVEVKNGPYPGAEADRRRI